jgi:aspartyl-tRNA(Asn)/glutamyl-tRNA(Gln) amidotransferase subunit B
MKIGFETHIPLDTTTKLFSDEARGRLSAYAQGEPGTRPVLQGKAVRYALKLALTLDMDIAPALTFDRKQYFYPDLPKGYQITQHRHPLASNGVFTTSHGDTDIKEIHVEEDPSRLEHTENGTRVDDKRSGEPLIELVTTPCLTTIKEALTFLDELSTHCEYLGILDQSKGFKTDVNVSIESTQHTRVEVKNVTGRDNVKDALRYEVWRQQSAVETGHSVDRETRQYDDEKNMTASSRSKETYQDYAYIPEPDIPCVDTKPLLERVREDLPKPRQDIIDELIEEDVSKQEATKIASHPEKRSLYESFRADISPGLTQTVITEHLPHVLKAQEKEWGDVREHRIDRIALVISDEDLPENTVKDLLWNTLFDDKQPRVWLDEQRGDEPVHKTVERLIDEHPSRVEAHKDGDEAVVNAFIGDLRDAHPNKEVSDLVEKMKSRLDKA